MRLHSWWKGLSKGMWHRAEGGKSKGNGAGPTAKTLPPYMLHTDAQYSQTDAVAARHGASAGERERLTLGQERRSGNDATT